MLACKKLNRDQKKTKRCFLREGLQIQASGEVTHLGKERKLNPPTLTILPFILKNC